MLHLPIVLTVATLTLVVAVYKLVATRYYEDGSPAASMLSPKDELQLSPKMRDLIANISEGVVFQLYTTETKETPEILDVLSMEQNKKQFKYFNPKWPVRICIHGWNSNNKTMEPMRTALLEQDDYNVIRMDWTKIGNLSYQKVRPMVTPLGTWLAYFMDVLIETYDLDISNFHIIGYSVGAHISGEAGRYTIKGQVGRITGLDPAGPLFKQSRDAISHDAAAFVDIIHTCGNVFGYRKPLGHVDFYPNGGTCIQPGCNLNPRPTCSHFRAIDFFTESIFTIGFFSQPFKGGPRGHFPTNRDQALMGYLTDRNARGVYYLKTSSHSPFALLLSSEIDKRNKKYFS